MSDPRTAASRADFPATRWSLVASVRRGAADAAAASRAMDALCRDYWWPLYAFARRTGLNAEDAQDAVQGFIAGLIEREAIARADPERGILHISASERTMRYPLAALQANVMVRRRAIKSRSRRSIGGTSAE